MSKTKKRSLIRLSDWQNHHPWPKIRTLRYFRYNAAKFGMLHVFEKLRGQVLIDEKAFFEWVEKSKLNISED